jgi:hypothetical protein
MNHRRRIAHYFFVLLTLISVRVTAQQPGLRDSLARQLMRDSAHIFRVTIVKPYLKVENRNSFLANEHVNLLGFLAGATLYEKHIVSAGYYFLDRGSRHSILLVNEKASQQFSKLSYVDFAYQYILLSYRYIQLNLPLEVGYGSYKGTYIDSLGKVTVIKGNMVPLAAGLQLFIKPIRWLGVSATGGYRQVKHDVNNFRLDGFYYSFGLWVDARHVIRSLHYRSVKRRFHKEAARS